MGHKKKIGDRWGNANAEFSVTYCNHMPEHVLAGRKAPRALRRVLRPRGQAVSLEATP
jgi:hypothetical protein